MLSHDFYSQTINQDTIYPSFWLVKEKYSLGTKKVLDLGCADGRYLSHFGSGSMGVELSQEGIKAALDKNLTVREYNINHLNSSDFEQCDAVFSSHVIEHLDSPLTFLRGCNGILKSEGTLVIGYPVERSLVRLFDSYFSHDGHFYSFSNNCMTALMTEAGFGQVEFIYDLPFANRFKIVNSVQKWVDKIPGWTLSFWANAVYVVAKKQTHLPGIK